MIGLIRRSTRATMAQINAVTSSAVGYLAGMVNRFNRRPKAHPRSVIENNLDPNQMSRMLVDAWSLYRDNPYARKIVSSLQSKVIGQGMQPESLAANRDGSPNVKFRARAKQLWADIQHGFDIHGIPGMGGQTFPGMQRLILKAVMLTGDALFKLEPIDEFEMKDRELPVPMALQIIDSRRLADEIDIPAGKVAEGNVVYRGIELDQDGNRVAYWIVSSGIGNTPREATRYPASTIGHLYLEEDIDQYRGTTWFASSLIGMRDTGDLQHNVLKSSAMAACVVGSYSKPTGAARFGLNSSQEANAGTADGTDLTDIDGNAVTKLQPAMMLNVGKDGKFELHSPNQPNMNPEGFIQHMLRGVAAGTPGIKSSTVTGDYRNSSFSSEKSADNDIWPEVEALQDWFSSNFCQRVYEAVIKSAVFAGYFNGIINQEEYLKSPARFHLCKWQGPVSRSINPTDDAEAAGLRVQKGISSMQMECAKVNVNWRDVLAHNAELFAAAKEMGLPAEVVNNILGVGANDVIAQTNKATSGAEKPVPRSLREEYQLERLVDAQS